MSRSSFIAKMRACDERLVAEVAEVAKLPASAKAVGKPLPARRETRSATQAKLRGQDMCEVLFRKPGTDLTAIEVIRINTCWSS